MTDIVTRYKEYEIRVSAEPDDKGREHLSELMIQRATGGTADKKTLQSFPDVLGNFASEANAVDAGIAYLKKVIDGTEPGLDV